MNKVILFWERRLKTLTTVETMHIFNGKLMHTCHAEK